MVNLKASLFSCTLFLFSSEPYMHFPGSFPLNSPHPTAYIPLCARVISQLSVNRNTQHDTVPLTLNSSCGNNELSICPPIFTMITKYKHYFSCMCFCWRIKFRKVTVLKVTSRWSMINLQGNFNNDLLTECCKQGTYCPKLFSDKIKNDFSWQTQNTEQKRKVTNKQTRVTWTAGPRNRKAFRE